MASYTNRLTSDSKVFIEQNIYDNGELMFFKRVNRQMNGNHAPTSLCCFTADGRTYYSLKIGSAAELEKQGLRVVSKDLKCLEYQKPKLRRDCILALIKEDSAR